MSEAPAKLWIDPEYIEDENDCVSRVKIMDRDVQYIRADIVEEMREALEESIRFTNIGHITLEKARTALKRLEGE